MFIPIMNCFTLTDLSTDCPQEYFIYTMEASITVGGNRALREHFD